MMSLESQTSNPFVVMTNENQWDVSEGILLQKAPPPSSVHFYPVLDSRRLRTHG
jgi:hypothetical protein